MVFIKIIVGAMFLFIFITGGLWVIQDNIAVGNFQDDAELTNKTTILTTISSKLNTTYTPVREQYDDMVEGEVEDSTSALDFLINNGFNAVIRVVKMFGIIDNVIEELADIMEIPSFIIDAFVIMVFATITITLIYMMFRYQPR